jgi:hypothetical protein
MYKWACSGQKSTLKCSGKAPPKTAVQGDWLQVDSPSKVADVVLEWLVEVLWWWQSLGLRWNEFRPGTQNRNWGGFLTSFLWIHCQEQILHFNRVSWSQGPKLVDCDGPFESIPYLSSYNSLYWIVWEETKSITQYSDTLRYIFLGKNPWRFLQIFP